MVSISDMSVVPTARCHEVLRNMIGDLHRQADLEGDVVAGLCCSEWPIYGLFGYGMASWPRPLNVPKFLEVRGWSGEARIILLKHDQEGYAKGTFELEVCDGQVSCVPMSAQAQLEMSVGVLGAISLGRTSVTSFTRIGRIHVRRLGDAQLSERLVIPREPTLFQLRSLTSKQAACISSSNTSDDLPSEGR